MVTTVSIPGVFFNTIGTRPARAPRAAGRHRHHADARRRSAWTARASSRAAPNPQSGPICVEGAEPGDALAVTDRPPDPDPAHRLDLTAAGAQRRRSGACRDLSRRAPRRLADRPRRRHRAAREPAAGTAPSWSLPLAPMIGCFGVAPAGGQAISTATSGAARRQHGLARLRARRDGLLPGASCPARFLSSATATPARATARSSAPASRSRCEVEFTVRAAQGQADRLAARRDRRRTIFTVGNARPLDQALQHATTEMLAGSESDYGLDAVAASHLLGQVVALRRRQRLQPGLHRRLPDGHCPSRGVE